MLPIFSSMTEWIKVQGRASSLESKARYEETGKVLADNKNAYYDNGLLVFRGVIASFSKLLDKVAGLFVVVVMSLVVANILLRSFFSKSILGTYEFVGFLTAAMIGLSLANCAIQNGHIAIGLFIDRLPKKLQNINDILINTISLLFWLLASWHLGKHAYNMALSGVVSPTTQTPYYYFVYMVAFGVFALALVILVRLVESIIKVALTR